MAEENQAPEGEQTPQYSPAETTAMEQGWVPKEQWTGDGKWRDAEAFLDRGELFGKIDRQNREMKALRESLGDVKRHYESVKETEYKRAIASLRAEKKTALQEGNADAVIEIEDRLDTIRDHQTEARMRASQPQYVDNGESHPEFQAFVNKNPWYTQSRPMKSYADALGTELREQGKSPSDVLRAVEAAVRKEFPQRFSNPNRDRPSGVESGTGNSGTSNSSDKFVLNDMEKKMMNRLVESGVLTKEKYMADLKAKKEMS
jgi:hypothetical protein